MKRSPKPRPKRVRQRARCDACAAASNVGYFLHAYYWKWDEGDRELRRASELNGSSDLDDIATFIRTRRLDEAIVRAERARERNARAFEVYQNLALAYRANGEFDRALAEMRRGLELFPDLPRAHFQLGATLALSGRPRDAIAEFERAVAGSSPGTRGFRRISDMPMRP